MGDRRITQELQVERMTAYQERIEAGWSAQRIRRAEKAAQEHEKRYPAGFCIGCGDSLRTSPFDLCSNCV